MTQPPTPHNIFRDPGQPPAGRHGCLTAWLILIIVASGLTALATPFSGEAIHRVLPNYPMGLLWLSTALCLVNIACAIGLLRYQKWGFWGIVVVSVVSAGANLAGGLGVGNVISGLVGVGILYGVLNIGDANTKAWPRLR